MEHMATMTTIEDQKEIEKKQYFEAFDYFQENQKIPYFVNLFYLVKDLVDQGIILNNDDQKISKRKTWESTLSGSDAIEQIYFFRLMQNDDLFSKTLSLARMTASENFKNYF